MALPDGGNLGLELPSGVSTHASTASLIAENHRMSAAYVTMLEMFRYPVALVWIGLTAWGVFDLRSFINADKLDLHPVEGALPVVPSVSFASVSTAAALIQSESGVEYGSGVPFVSAKVEVVSALCLGAALLALAAAVGNGRLLLCAAVSFLVCMGTSVWAMSMDRRAAWNSLEMVAVLSAAYFLYLLGRFRMERLDRSRGTTAKEAVILMVSKSNIVMLSSGVTLLVMEAVMLASAVPKDHYFESFLSALVPISLAIATSLSFMPLTLLLLPDFFNDLQQGCNCCGQARRRGVRSWLWHRASEILLLTVAVAAPVCFVCSSLQAQPP